MLGVGYEIYHFFVHLNKLLLSKEYFVGLKFLSAIYIGLVLNDLKSIDWVKKWCMCRNLKLYSL